MPLRDLISTAGALSVVIGLIIVLRFGARLVLHRRGGGVETAITLTGQLSLDGKRRVYLVRAGTGQALLLTGGASDVMLAWPPQPETAG